MLLLDMRGITKRFHGVTALSDVNLAVRAGEIHAVVGENGAGKSTLMKVLSGKQPEINDTKTYNNGVKVVPSYLLKPVSVDSSNWKKVLIDSGYYKEAQVK